MIEDFKKLKDISHQNKSDNVIDIKIRKKFKKKPFRKKKFYKKAK